MKTLALFDFDGTITTQDTFTSFVKFYHGTPKFLAGFLFFSPVLILMKMGLLDNGQVKNMVFSYFFKGVNIESFNTKCSEYCKTTLPRLIRLKAVEKIKEHQKNGDEIFIISASPENWITPWAEGFGIKVISTQIEVNNDSLTGRLASNNCYGPEKVVRIKKELDLSGYNQIVAYGDSRGDREMFELAGESFYKPFRD
jgi:HAD superfamily hydrolase (TIGR01490 family)